MLLLFTHFMAK